MTAGLVTLAEREAKPLVIFEVGMTHAAGPRATWVKEMFAYIRSEPRIKGVLWFDANTGAADPKNDFWLDGDKTDAELFKAYKQATSDPTS